MTPVLTFVSVPDCQYNSEMYEFAINSQPRAVKYKSNFHLIR